MDTLVFDIETKNFFTDPEVGWNNFDALKISVVGVYSYIKNAYFCYTEHEMEDLAKMFREANRIVGFSINRYDVPVLHGHFGKLADTAGLDLYEKSRVDLLEEVELATGSRISLEKLSQANLGTGKTGEGDHAIELYKEEKIDELKSYCLKDVELTKELFELYRHRKYLLIPDRESGELRKVEFTPSYDLVPLF
ncbi:MAG: ribonuclease H-like domain-containing protein [Candidatus Liptonbacteria bacterium]